MIFFPDWSDLSLISSNTRAGWEGEISIRTKYRRYFNGEVFKDRVQMEGEQIGMDTPFLYPLGLNLVKMLCLAQTDALFGEWDTQIVQFDTKQELVANPDHARAIELLSDIMTGSSANAMFWELALDRNVYGGGVVKVSPALSNKGHVRWQRIPLESFYPVWDPDDPDNILECYIMVQMTAEQAKAKYGLQAEGIELVTRVEHWTKSEYTNTINGTKIDAYSGVNPWGFIPFVYIPHCRTTHFWGLSLTEDIIPVQDELNAILADAGEALNYNSHPVRWGINLPRAFNNKNFPLSPNALWDLGRNMPGADKAEVGILEAQHPVSAETFSYVKFLYDWARTGAFAPPIAFGEDNGGGQRSGSTLEIRMIPLIRANKRSRSYMGAGIQKLMELSGKILKQKNFPDVPARAIEKLMNGEITPRFYPIFPQDHQAIVDEVVKLNSTPVPTISMETSQKILGRGLGEVDRIKDNLKDEELKSDEQKANEDAIKAKTQADSLSQGQAGKSFPQGIN